jgi:hypothetical protein
MHGFEGENSEAFVHPLGTALDGEFAHPKTDTA